MRLEPQKLEVRPDDYYEQLRGFCKKHLLNCYGAYTPPVQNSSSPKIQLTRGDRMQQTIIPLIEKAPAAHSALEAETMLRQVVHLSENNTFGGMTVDESTRIYPNELRGFYTLKDDITLLLAKAHITLLGKQGELQIWERDPHQADPNKPPFLINKLILNKAGANGQKLNVTI